MNATNRGANRLLLLLISIILLAAAASAVLLALVATVRTTWGSQARSIRSSAPDWIGKPAVGSVSLLALGVALLAVILAVSLIVFVVRQGRGHASRVLEQHHSGTGTTLIDLGVPRALLEQELTDRPEFVATRVSAYQVKSTPTLKVTVQCRRGVAPTDAAHAVSDALRDLDTILGTSIPALVQISGGFRSRTASRARLT